MTIRFALLFTCLLPLQAVAESEGDRDYGAYLAGECTICHRADGNSAGIPPIVGMESADFVAALQAYKRKDRDHPGMQVIASRLGDEEIAALAAYFGSVEP